MPWMPSLPQHHLKALSLPPLGRRWDCALSLPPLGRRCGRTEARVEGQWRGERRLPEATARRSGRDLDRGRAQGGENPELNSWTGVMKMPLSLESRRRRRVRPAPPRLSRKTTAGSGSRRGRSGSGRAREGEAKPVRLWPAALPCDRSSLVWKASSLPPHANRFPLLATRSRQVERSVEDLSRHPDRRGANRGWRSSWRCR